MGTDELEIVVKKHERNYRESFLTTISAKLGRAKNNIIILIKNDSLINFYVFYNFYITVFASFLHTTINFIS